MSAHDILTTSSNKTITAQSLTEFCDDYLSATAFKDYAPNGLQIDGGRPIERIVTGVTACDALIDAAIADHADAIMVHHGYFWKGEPAPLTGMKGQRIRKLMQHGISLIGYHLPLDAHPVIGNNATLAAALDMTIIGALYPAGHILLAILPFAPRRMLKALSLRLLKHWGVYHYILPLSMTSMLIPVIG